MLQPHSYPRLLGQALVLEPDPCVVLADDDNPWIEGLFLITLLGTGVGLARLIGGALAGASLPPPEALLQTMVQALRQAQAAPALEAVLHQVWPGLALLLGHGGWLRLYLVVATPLAMILFWLLYGFLAYGSARLLGGQGGLNATLGVLALAAAPWIFGLAQVLPFVRVPTLLLVVWGLLIAYRGLEVAHDLPTDRAVLATVLPMCVLLFLALTGFVGVLLWAANGGLG